MRVVVLALSLLVFPNLASAQPASRGAIPLPAKAIAEALQLPSARPSTVLLNAVRVLYTSPDLQLRRRSAAALSGALDSGAAPADLAPLPLGSAMWRDTILASHPSDDRLVAAILRDRPAALLFLGLSALDDETLAWLGSRPETVRQLRANAAVFGGFGRGLRVRDGAVIVPGGAEAEPLWRLLVGVEARDGTAFVARLFAGDGRLAFFYDTVAHLDVPHQRFALGLALPPSLREARLRALVKTLATVSPEWHADEEPFVRPLVDAAMLLSQVMVRPDGALAPPLERRIWERVFRADLLNEVPFAPVTTAEVTAMSKTSTADASWLAARTLGVPYAVGRRRLDVLLFAQRLMARRPTQDEALLATTLRGYLAFPALMQTLERAGVSDAAVLAAAAAHASRVSAVALPFRAAAIAECQAAIALMQRAVAVDTLNVGLASRLIATLAALPISTRDGYGEHFARWFRDDFLRALATPSQDSSEATLLAAIAGIHAHAAPPPQVAWEGRLYTVDPASAEWRRLRLLRERQKGVPLDAALNDADALPTTLVAIVYAVHLGDPDGAAVTAGNVAARHDFALTAGAGGSSAAWTLPIEDFDRRSAWRLRGSILGLEGPLGRLAMRRVNPAEMPDEPRIGPRDRQTMMTTAALMAPAAMTDAARDAIAAAIQHGRARVEALPANASRVDDVARDAGLSEWRRAALAWDVAHGDRAVGSRFSLLELLWLGLDAGGMPPEWQAWGAAALPRDGCLCLELPPPGPWENDAGRAVSVLGTRAADAGLRLAEALAGLKLPAALAPALAGYVMQDVLEHARLATPDDWDEVGRAARELPQERIVDYIAALAARGPLLPVTKDESVPHNP